jgi:hypothetical protein
VRLALNIIGLLLALFGVVWILQGLDVLGADDFMAGQNKWALVGAGVLLAAGIVLTSANRHRKHA